MEEARERFLSSIDLRLTGCGGGERDEGSTPGVVGPPVVEPAPVDSAPISEAAVRQPGVEYESEADINEVLERVVPVVLPEQDDDGTRDVVGAVAVVEPWSREARVLEDADAVRECEEVRERRCRDLVSQRATPTCSCAASSASRW